MEEVINLETKRHGLQICKQYLGGNWMKVNLKDFVMERIRGGLSNKLYKCYLSDNIEIDEEEQRTVLIRLYGQIIQENPETVLTDSVIFSLLAEKNLGPRLYGVFTKGRVEEYLPSRVLQCSELSDPFISVACARKIAQFHKLSIPIVKQPRWLFDTMNRYLDDALDNLSFCDVTDDSRSKLEVLVSYNLATELTNLKIMLEKVHSPVVFCHNDLQEGNILFLENHDDKSGKNWQLRPIDFEYASYNYRGFDIGNHFCEWCYDYKCEEPPYFFARLEDYPSREQQLLFIRAYLDENGKIAGNNSKNFSTLNEGDNLQESMCKNYTDEEELMLLEINSFALASHFYWGLWAIVQSHISDIQFGYLDYALARFGAYFHQKRIVLEEFGSHISCNGFSEAFTSSTTGPHIS